MGLFDKKYCDVCGEKIGFLGNRKLEDGNLCKNCAQKLSPLFSERRSSTVEQIKEQLAYREENERQLASLNPDLTFGRGEKLYIDCAAGKFVCTRMSDFRSGNPDIVSLSQVTGVSTDIREYKTEIYTRDSEGKRISYHPPRYTCAYGFHVTVSVDSPWFDEIRFELSENRRPDSRLTSLYHEYENEAADLEKALLKKNTVPGGSNTIMVPFDSNGKSLYRYSVPGSDALECCMLQVKGTFELTVSDEKIYTRSREIGTFSEITSMIVTQLNTVLMTLQPENVKPEQIPTIVPDIFDELRKQDHLETFFGLKPVGIQISSIRISEDSEKLVAEMKQHMPELFKKKTASEQPAAAPTAKDGKWTCPACMAENNGGKFCEYCGTKRPE